MWSALAARLLVVALTAATAACGTQREPYELMCEAGTYLAEADGDARAGAAAVFASDAEGARPFIDAAREKVDIATDRLDAVRDTSYRGGDTWRGLHAAAGLTQEGIEALASGDATLGTQRLDMAIGQLDAISPPLPDICVVG